MAFLNLAFYRFVDFSEKALPEMRSELLAECLRLDLKGTILLAPEGINGFVAGTPDNARQLVDRLKGRIPALRDATFKESLSDHQPFNRMLVRLKKEIITMGRPEVRPARSTGPRLEPRELKRWLDLGREFVFLDTRNDYETRLGTFEGALELDLKTFRQFPEKVRELAERRPELKEKTIVSFCTGGIRCEKASALLLSEGFKDVYQLEGGILRYFEEVGGAGYRGDCFVFDQRVAVDSCLRETGAVLCYNCQSPVSEDEQRQPSYVYEVSCPHCLGRPKAHKEKIAEALKQRAE